ncbi:MAG: DMT family transporter [Rhodospirillaceae bacterium]|jgi:drug/metabolite transporter (DMT)-like permease|nr:DMT family transporter [Rhodospirillaceae bacterium]MBT4939884.1 DMT family transporter [Rhodospirillaceae bacterium]MBT7955899.1 DMT family transporter [Rhodospirillaceae bacterium]
MNSQSSADTASLIQGFLWMGGAVLSFLFMAIAGRELSDTMNTFEIMTFRTIVALAITIIFVMRGGWQEIRTERLPLHLLRNIFHFGGQFGWFLGISLLPLATVFALEFTIPIWAALLAVVVLRERLHHARIIAIICGIGGVLIILKPGSEVIDLSSLIVVGAAFGYAVSYIASKPLVATDSPLAILFYMNLIQLPLGLIPAAFSWVPPTMGDVPWIALVGVTGLTAHYCITRAFMVADTLTVIPLDFLRLPMIAVIGFFFYQESIELALFAGAVVIFAGNYYNIRYEAKLISSPEKSEK